MHLDEDAAFPADSTFVAHHHELQPLPRHRSRWVLPAILVTETAERVAYFGFRAVLVLYFTNGLNFSDNDAVALFAATAALAYFSPMIGALLADGAWGRYKVILTFGWIYIGGLGLLSLGAHLSDGDEEHRQLTLERWLSFAGLFLACLGTGGIKPCVSAFGADQISLQQFPAGDEGSRQREEEVRAFFALFYFCINIGAVSSFALIPIVKKAFGFGVAFLVPFVFMICAMIVFRSQHSSYRHSHLVQRSDDEPQPSLWMTFQACGLILYQRTMRFCNMSSSDAQEEDVHFPLNSPDPNDLAGNLQASSTENASMPRMSNKEHEAVMDEAARALHVLPVLAFYPIYWMLYDQQSSVWTLQAERMALHGLEPEQLNVLNPVEILIFIPFFDKIVYPAVQRLGFNIGYIRRMQYGMFLTAIAFFASGLLEQHMQGQPANSVHVAWQIPQITILTVAEILVSVTGLEFAYAQAPKNMQAFLLAVYLLTTAVGDGLGALLYATVFGHLNLVTTLAVCGVMMVLNMICFSIVLRRWEPYDQMHYSQPGVEMSGWEAAATDKEIT